MRARTIRRGVAASLVALAAAAPAAEAARLDDGRTRLRFDAATFQAIDSAGLVVATAAPARAGRLRAAFPIIGGDANPANGRGFYSHRGALAFTDGGDRIVQLQQLRTSVGGRHPLLTARVGNARITVAVLKGRAKVTHDADFVRLKGLRAVLTSTAADALNAALATDVFERGVKLGRVDTRAHLADLVLDGGYTGYTPDAGTITALEGAGITVGPLRGTEVGDRGDVILPLVSGIVERTTFVGRVRHAGGLVFRSGGREVAIANFNLDVTRDPVLTALTPAGRIEIATLELPDARPDVSGDRVTVDGVRLALTAEAARALNAALATTAFAEGVPLGTAVVRGVIL